MYLRELQEEDFEIAIKVELLSYNPIWPYSPLTFALLLLPSNANGGY